MVRIIIQETNEQGEVWFTLEQSFVDHSVMADLAEAISRQRRVEQPGQMVVLMRGAEA